MALNLCFRIVSLRYLADVHNDQDSVSNSCFTNTGYFPVRLCAKLV